MPHEGHHRYGEDLAAYLLDALSPGEAREFEAHLAGCAACQVEGRWLRGAVELLPSSVEQLEPPAELRKRLMQAVRAEADARRPVREPRSRRRGLALLLRPTTAVAAVAIAAAGVAGYVVGEGGGPGTKTVAAQATPAQPDARASVVRSGDTAELRVAHLPPQRRGHVYQVWLSRSGRPGLEPSSLFVVGRDGTGSATIPGGLEGVRAVMVSLEPEGGSARPSSSPVLSAKL